MVAPVARVVAAAATLRRKSHAHRRRQDCRDHMSQVCRQCTQGIRHLHSSSRGIHQSRPPGTCVHWGTCMYRQSHARRGHATRPGHRYEVVAAPVVVPVAMAAAAAAMPALAAVEAAAAGRRMQLVAARAAAAGAVAATAGTAAVLEAWRYSTPACYSIQGHE